MVFSYSISGGVKYAAKKREDASDIDREKDCSCSSTHRSCNRIHALCTRATQVLTINLSVSESQRFVWRIRIMSSKVPHVLEFLKTTPFAGYSRQAEYPAFSLCCSALSCSDLGIYSRCNLLCLLRLPSSGALFVMAQAVAQV